MDHEPLHALVLFLLLFGVKWVAINGEESTERTIICLDDLLDRAAQADQFPTHKFSCRECKTPVYNGNEGGRTGQARVRAVATISTSETNIRTALPSSTSSLSRSGFSRSARSISLLMLG